MVDITIMMRLSSLIIFLMNGRHDNTSTIWNPHCLLNQETRILQDFSLFLCNMGWMFSYNPDLPFLGPVITLHFSQGELY
jgi:hypothetical protein